MQDKPQISAAGSQEAPGLDPAKAGVAGREIANAGELDAFYSGLERAFFASHAARRTGTGRAIHLAGQQIKPLKRFWRRRAGSDEKIAVKDQQALQNRLRDMWFFNGDGSGKKYPIRFLRPELAESYGVRVFRRGVEYRGKEALDSSGLFGTWDFLLISLFDSAFSVRRAASESGGGGEPEKFVIRSLPACCSSGSEDGGNEVRTMTLEKRVVETASEEGGDRPNTINPDGRCKYMKLSNKRIVVAQNRILAEPVCCRTMLLYILAKSYTYKLEMFLNQLSDKALFNAHNPIATVGAWFSKLLPLVPFGPNAAINRLNKRIVKFKNLYLFSMPLSLNRVEDLAAAWDDIYSFYRIKTVSEEIAAKISDLTQLSRNSHASVITSYMFVLAIVGVLMKANVSFWGLVTALLPFLD